MEKGYKCCFYSESNQMLNMRGWVTPTPKSIEVWNKNTLLGKAEIIVSQGTSLPTSYGEWKYEKKQLEIKDEIIIKYFFNNDEPIEELVEVSRLELPVVGSVNRCDYETDTKCLRLNGWILPRPDQVKIVIDDEIITTEAAIKRVDVYNNWSDYNEWNSGWSCVMKQLPNKPKRISVMAIYKGICGYIFSPVQILESTAPVVGSINSCMYETELERLTVVGWCLPKPDYIEIWDGSNKIEEVSVDIARKDVCNNWSEYNEIECGWELCLSEVQKQPREIIAKAIYNGECKKEFVFNNINVIKAKIIGTVNRCVYETELERLTVGGWCLPKPDYIEIWDDTGKIKEVSVDIARKDVYNNWSEYNEIECGWELCLSDVKKQPSEIIAKAIYNRECKKEFVFKNIDIIKAKIIGAVNRCIYETDLKQLEIGGWCLPKPNYVEIWNGTVKVGQADVEIERTDLYRKWPEYNEKQCGWSIKLSEIQEVTNEIIAKAIYDSGLEKEFTYKNIEVISSKILGNINQCSYDNVLKMFQINGWCLPAPKQVEVWCGGEQIGVAETALVRTDVYENFPLYNEKNSGWKFEKYNVEGISSEITIKAFFEDGRENVWEASITKTEYKVISFDLFDTLVVRPVVQPTDMFKIVGRRAKESKYFKEMRIQAEQYARRTKPSDLDDIGLDCIYDAYKELFGTSDEQIEMLKCIEMEVELEYLRPRYGVKKIFEQAVASNAEVIVTTDMYLPLSCIEEILHRNGYSGYQKIYLSSNENAAKGSGKLYKKLTEVYEKKGVQASEILHIGDNLRADIALAKQHGWNTFYIPKTVTMLEQNECLAQYAKNINARLDNGFLVGSLANYLFDDPFTEYDKKSYFNGDINLLGPVLVAPFLLNFTIWMLRNIYKKSIDTLFLAYRDGYLVEKIIKLIEIDQDKKLDMVPIYLSRMVRYNGYCNRKNGFFKALTDFNVPASMKVKDFVKSRLLVENEKQLYEVCKLIKNETGKDENDVIGSIGELFPIFTMIENIYYENAKKNMIDIDGYCLNFMEGHERAAVFDVGYRGSVVDFLGTQYGKVYDGYQILSYSFGDRHTLGNENTESFIKYGMNKLNSVLILHNFIEDIISIEEGTSYKVQKKGNKYVVCKELYEKKSENIKIIQTTIMSFIEKFVELFKKDIMEIEFERFPEFDFLTQFLTNPSIKDAQILNKMYFSDSTFLGSNNENIYQEWYSGILEKNGYKD